MSVPATNIDKVAPEVIIRDVSVRIGDEELKQGRTIGWYNQQIRNALDELAFTLKFEDLTTDISVPDNWATTLQLSVPKNMVDLQELYMWNGDCCTLESSVRVWFKRRLNNKNGKGTNYTAAISNTNSVYGQIVDSMNWYWWDGISSLPFTSQPICYANIQNGLIMFSPNCADYDHVRMVYSGTYGDYETTPCIPRYLVGFITAYVVMRCYENMAARNPRSGYQGMYDRARDEIYNFRTGLLYSVRRMIKSDTQWQLNSINDNAERGNW